MPSLALAVLLGVLPTRLAFSDLLRDVDGRLVPTPKMRAASGKRVRMQGFVAELETPPQGGFWLCPAPVHGDESGGGTADLPPESVFVVVRSAPRTSFVSPRRPVDVTGVLEVGPRVLADGVMTHLRLILDRPSLPASKASPAPRRKSLPPSHS